MRLLWRFQILIWVLCCAGKKKRPGLKRSTWRRNSWRSWAPPRYSSTGRRSRSGGGAWRSVGDTIAQRQYPKRNRNTDTTPAARLLLRSQQVCSWNQRTEQFSQKFHFGSLTVFLACLCFTAAAKFRRESLFCPDELDSLFSYFDTGSGPRSKRLTSLMYSHVCESLDTKLKCCIDARMNFKKQKHWSAWRRRRCLICPCCGVSRSGRPEQRQRIGRQHRRKHRHPRVRLSGGQRHRGGWVLHKKV